MTELWPNGFVRAGTSARAFLEALAGEGFSLHHMDAERARLEAVTVGEMLARIERNAQRSFDDNPVMRTWGWYTNLLCLRGEDAPG